MLSRARRALRGAVGGVAALLMVAGAFCSTAAADVTMSAADRKERRAWSAMYWARIIEGKPAQGAENFRFSNPDLNSVLNAPVVGAYRRLASVHGDRIADVEHGLARHTGLGGLSWNGIADYMLCEEEWNGGVNHENWGGGGTHEHLHAPLPTPKPHDQPSLVAADATLDGGELLPIEAPATTEAVRPAHFLEPEQAYSIEVLRALAGMVASKVDVGPHRITDELLGRETYSEEFYRLLLRETSQWMPNAPFVASFIDAAFGRHDLVLTMLEVHFGEHYVLIDTTNGNLVGPFEGDSIYDARELLRAHALFRETDRIAYIDSLGIPVVRPMLYMIDGDSGTVQPMAITCVGCVACLIAATASCAILCIQQPWWDVPGEGRWTCMGKCALAALDMPLDLIELIRQGLPIDPAHIASSACGMACGGCGVTVVNFIKRLMKPRPRWFEWTPEGWVPYPRPRCYR